MNEQTNTPNTAPNISQPTGPVVPPPDIHIQDNSHLIKPLFIGLIIFIVVAVALLWWRADKVQDTMLGVSGIQGLVTWQTPEINSFGLSQSILKDVDSAPEERSYTVLWDAETMFYTYADVYALADGVTTSSDVSALVSGQNAVIVPRGKVKGDVVTASAVYIAPAINMSVSVQEVVPEETATSSATQ